MEARASSEPERTFADTQRGNRTDVVSVLGRARLPIRTQYHAKGILRFRLEGSVGILARGKREGDRFLETHLGARRERLAPAPGA